MTLGINDTQHKDSEDIEYQVPSTVMLSVAFFIDMLSVIMQSVITPENKLGC